MLSLKEIKKDYVTGDTKVEALKGVSIDFRDNEFVSVLGASGCGKTTLLNIVGGLDRYTSGDLIINGVSTEEYSDGDWDTYRNHTIGFVFQTYNLIMHQTVLGNVELALTLSGVSPKERKEMAARSLIKVGLGEQLNKKPNQLSGGQMQRVAIARAIVNNPDIILADEPTGALDTQTSVQIMDILKEISKDKLVIMVTHNPELAEKYSTRIIRLTDGELLSDSNPVGMEEYNALLVEAKLREKGEDEICLTEADVAVQDQNPPKTRVKRKKKPSMSFKTALTLSLKNLLTKKARTLLVSFAGSIGIIGIALILSLSDGFQSYINKVQEDTLSTYPLTITQESVDSNGLMSAMMDVATGGNKEKDPNKIYANNLMLNMLTALGTQQKSNNLKDFNAALVDARENELDGKISAIQYTYNMDLQVFFKGTEPLNAAKKTVQVAPSALMSRIFGSTSSMAGAMVGMSVNTWAEMLDNQELLQSQYDLVGENSRWPKEYNQVVVVVDKNEEISDYILYSLGLLDQAKLEEMLQKIYSGQSDEIKIETHSFDYDDILGLKYKVVSNPELYNYDQTKEKPIVTAKTGQALEAAVDNGIEVEVVGIIKPKEAAAATSISGTIAYRSDLLEYVVGKNNASPIIQYQQKYPTFDIFTGTEFKTLTNSGYTIDDVRAYLLRMSSMMGGMTEEEVDGMIEMYITQYMSQGMSREEAEAALIADYSEFMGESQVETATYAGNLAKLGYVDLASPSSVNIYAKDFESKDEISDWITAYNEKAKSEDRPEDVISYTDLVGIMMSSISTIINAISYVLIGFVSVSLVVSSIMIGVITYISVLERIKEIGILRSIGASKRDISRVFNAETFIIGLAAGLIGVGTAILIDIPINLILATLASGLGSIAALPWWGAVGLVVISVVLTLISGIIPSRMAAKKDPVIALRTE